MNDYLYVLSTHAANPDEPFRVLDCMEKRKFAYPVAPISVEPSFFTMKNKPITKEEAFKLDNYLLYQDIPNDKNAHAMRFIQQGKFIVVGQSTPTILHVWEYRNCKGKISKLLITNLTKGTAVKWPMNKNHEGRKGLSCSFNTLDEAVNSGLLIDAVTPHTGTSIYPQLTLFGAPAPMQLSRWIGMLSLAYFYGSHNLPYFTDSWLSIEFNHINKDVNDNSMANLEPTYMDANTIHGAFFKCCEKFPAFNFLFTNDKSKLLYRITANDIAVALKKIIDNNYHKLDEHLSAADIGTCERIYGAMYCLPTGRIVKKYSENLIKLIVATIFTNEHSAFYLFS